MHAAGRGLRHVCGAAAVGLWCLGCGGHLGELSLSGSGQSLSGCWETAASQIRSGVASPPGTGQPRQGQDLVWEQGLASGTFPLHVWRVDLAQARGS